MLNLAAIIMTCLLYTSDAADERSSVDLGGRRIIKKKHHKAIRIATHRIRRMNTKHHLTQNPKDHAIRR